jgi:heme/copper-type cytochrome/quinol oxidase subunit 2
MSADHSREHLKHFLILASVAGVCGVAVYLSALGYEIGALPGDVAIAVAEYNLYFPATTTALVSVALNLTVYLGYSLVRHRLHMTKEHVREKEERLVYPK